MFPAVWPPVVRHREMAVGRRYAECTLIRLFDRLLWKGRSLA